MANLQGKKTKGIFLPLFSESFVIFIILQIQSITDASRGSIRRKKQSVLHAQEEITVAGKPEEEVTLQLCGHLKAHVFFRS